MRPPIAVMTGVLLCVPLSSASGEDAPRTSLAWMPIVFSDLQTPSASVTPFAELWAKEIAENDAAYAAGGDARYLAGHAPASEAHFVVRNAAKTVVLSVLNTATTCTIGKEDLALGVQVRTCPLKLAIYSAGNVEVTSGWRGCFLEFASAEADASASGMLAAYDPQLRAIKIGTLFNHVPVPGCTQSIPLRRAGQGLSIPLPLKPGMNP